MKKSYRAAIFVFAALILIVLISAFPDNAARETLSKRGSVSDEVREIQEKLAELGYYDYEIDGIFGSRTEKAVRQFQADKGLTQDGIVGKDTLAALGINTGDAEHSREVELLAKLISAESKGEPYIGQVAVGAVVLNRVKHPSFPNTISGVIYQPLAFSCVADGAFYDTPVESAYRAATEALNGMDPAGGAIYFYNPRTATSKWIFSRPVIKTIGNHVFCS